MLKRLIVAAVAVAVLTTTAVAVASIPSSSGVFTACVKADGTLRLIDAEAGATCKANERTVTWNQTGPQGPAGPEGPQGPAGPAGEDGTDGVAGIHVVQQAHTTDPDGTFEGKMTRCPNGEVVLGGGYRHENTNSIHIIAEEPVDAYLGDGVYDAWQVEGVAASLFKFVTIYAICATAN